MCTWADSELASGLAMQGGQAVISTAERDAAGQGIQHLLQNRLQVLTMEAGDFDTAAHLCLTEAAALAAGDTLHLTLCQRQPCTLVSSDQEMCRAAARHSSDVEFLSLES